MKLQRLRKLIIFTCAFILFAVAGRLFTAKAAGVIRLLNDRSREIVGADLLNSPGFVTPEGLTGKGQVVAVADSGVDKGSMEDIHPDLASDPGKKPRIIMLKSWAGRKTADDPVGHGTHMVGTIAGSGKASGGKFMGLAPDASIYFQGILDGDGNVSPPRDITDLFLPAYYAGARIHVDAWGAEANTYSAHALEADAFMRDHPDFLVIFGAGNAGPGGKTLTSEANSKNALVVGSSVSPRPAMDFSSEGTLDTAGFSSRGPTGDGRIKPDLLAPGTSVISTRSSLVKGNLPDYPMYQLMQGSSMSSAVAAGSAALLREYLQKGLSVPDPLASSLKAALINGARTGDKGPSGEGFGVLDLAGTVLALKEKTMLLAEERSGISSGQVNTYKIKIDNSESPFKATLAWTDPAGSLSGNKTLVNNLDLIVIAPDGKKYTGNGFLGGGPDDKNNVEQVYIEKPIAGEYLVEVRGVSVTVPAEEGAAHLAQDYSLVYGRPLATGIIKDTGAGGKIYLYDGREIVSTGREIHNVLDGHPSGGINPESGYRVYYSDKSLYIAGYQWNPESAQFRDSPSGRLWYEAGDAGPGGGYYQNGEAGSSVTVNGVQRENLADLPPGVEIKASLDGVTQTLWKVVTGYGILKGNASQVIHNEEGQITAICLFNDAREFKLSPGASYIYNDAFAGNDPLEAVFGAGNPDGLLKIMPGQQVTLVLSPSSGLVSSVLVNRSIVSGYVTGVQPQDQNIVIGSNSPFHVLTGAGVDKDKSAAALQNIVPGDYVVAVLMPGTGEILGLSAYSNVLYGQVLFTSDKDNMVYLNDFRNRFRMFSLTPATEVTRWGLRADFSTLSAGTWVRATLSPDGKEIWRMEVAELLQDQQEVLKSAGGGQLATAGGNVYRLSETATSVTKDGFPVTLSDLRPGEKITLSSLLAPDPYGKVPVAVRAASLAGARKPLFMAAVLEENGQLTLSGYTSGDRLYIWHENGTMENIPVAKGPGSFAWQLVFIENESAVKVVTVDSKSGAVTGKTFSRSEITAKTFSDIAGHWARDLILTTAASGIMAGYGDGTFRPDRPVTRGEMALILAGLTGNNAHPADPSGSITRAQFMVVLKNIVHDGEDGSEGNNIPFTDCGLVGPEERDAIIWGYSRGIIKGRTLSSFDPEGLLTRAEAAVLVQKTLQSFVNAKG